MRILVLGAGRMGLGTVFDLIHSPSVEAVTIADLESERAEAVAVRLASPKLTPQQIDVTDHAKVVDLMRKHDAAVSCVVYRHNLALARAALQAGTHFCDLGGNNTVVNAELALDGEARAAGINIVPDCGLAPGMVSVLVAHGAGRFEQIEAIHIRVGGLPQHPKPPLNYQLVFSVEGLINEYVEPARILRHGRIMEVESMTEIETLEFPPPFGVLEAFHTSGGSSTLPESFLGKAQFLDYKTIRYPGHCQQFKLLIDLGLASSEAIPVNGTGVVPFRLLAALLHQRLPADQPDAVLVRVEFLGHRLGRPHRLVYDIVDLFDPKTEMSAMMRTTAYPTSIVAQMMAQGALTQKGATTLERCVPPDTFMKALADRNIHVVEQMVAV